MEMIIIPSWGGGRPLPPRPPSVHISKISICSHHAFFFVRRSEVKNLAFFFFLFPSYPKPVLSLSPWTYLFCISMWLIDAAL